MARSLQNDARFSEIQQNNWNNCTEDVASTVQNNKHTTLDHHPLNNAYTNPNFTNNVYNPSIADKFNNKDENISFSTDNSHVHRQNYGNAMLNLGNGQLVRVFYDENNQQLIFPVTGQYELFSHSQGAQDKQILTSQTSHLFTLNQDYTKCVNENNSEMTTPAWDPTTAGTYSPFGQNHPLNHSEPSANISHNTIINRNKISSIKIENSPKRNENSPLAEISNKKRIVAEVKPMRPSYSDILTKNVKSNQQSDITATNKMLNYEAKSCSKQNDKPEKPNLKPSHDEIKLKGEKKGNNVTTFNESNETIADVEKRQKLSKKLKNKNNLPFKWSSMEDVSNVNKNHDNGSQFVMVDNHFDKNSKKNIKNNVKTTKKTKDLKYPENEHENKLENEAHIIFEDNLNDFIKFKKKKEVRNYQKTSKPVQDKKKSSQTKWKKNKPGYFLLVQNHLETWLEASWRALIWFFYLLSDICRMSAHLSFDLCTSAFTQTYLSFQVIWKSCKDRLYKMANNKLLLYIDRKFGNTRLGVWRKMKWFKKDKIEEDGNESGKLNANIPLPATGDEAMKRLLACKGKDPYSILGVSTMCTDEEIKRYYRRQAFLVHPDKNQQPGAEEAFKILQHAFDLIGEPERREAYEKRAVESRHAEAAWGELSRLLAQLHDKMEFAANTIRCTNCGRRHKRVLTDRPCFAARYCAQCKIRHSAKEGDIWAESSMFGLLMMYYACMDGAVYQITQWATCQKKNLKQLRADWHSVQYRIVLGSKATPAPDPRPPSHEPNLEEFLNNLYGKSGGQQHSGTQPPNTETKKRRNKKH